MKSEKSGNSGEIGLLKVPGRSLRSGSAEGVVLRGSAGAVQEWPSASGDGSAHLAMMPLVDLSNAASTNN